MSKAFEEIAQGLREAIAHANGEDNGAVVHRVLVSDVDVPAVRKKTKLSQEQFADLFAVRIGTLRNWEQNRRKPDGPAKVLLTLINRDPVGVLRMLGGKRKPAKRPPRKHVSTAAARRA